MSDYFVPAQQSKFGVHRHWKLVNPQKRLHDRMRHLVEVAALAEAAGAAAHAAYGADGQPLGEAGPIGGGGDPHSGAGSVHNSFTGGGPTNNSSQPPHATDNVSEEQREAYIFYHHHAHLIFLVYRLYVRSFAMPGAASANDLPHIDVASLMAVPAAVATLMGSAVSALPVAALEAEGPPLMVKRLIGDATIRGIASSVPAFLALTPAFYAHTSVAGLGAGAPPSPTLTSAAGGSGAAAASRTMTPLEALGAAAVLKQIVMALAGDFATLLPFGERASASSTSIPQQQQRPATAPKTVTEAVAPYPSPHCLLLRHQLLLAVVFEAQQLAQPSNDFAVRRAGFELLVRIYCFRMAGCLVPTAAARSRHSRGPAAASSAAGGPQQKVSALAMEQHGDQIDLSGLTSPPPADDITGAAAAAAAAPLIGFVGGRASGSAVCRGTPPRDELRRHRRRQRCRWKHNSCRGRRRRAATTPRQPFLIPRRPRRLLRRVGPR